ncbi:UNVERIFIED_CONTAM: hypothetical protein GTU68_060678 [Idotea baltica]|nr:hypothetical protein [Idotea baltica]
MKNDTDLGKLAKSYIDKGDLVPDEVTIKMLEDAVDSNPDASGFIFDGFPRTTGQAEALDKFLVTKDMKIDATIALEANDEILIQRLLERGKPGVPGQETEVILELKVLADVGLVGFPNAGKSTLLSVITSAKPKIADYEFTTLKPNLGIVEHRDFQSFVMADIPGIIEGAAEGKGLGHYFLRHIERNATLLFMVPADSDDIGREYNILLNELKRYNAELLDKERLIVISKSDMLDDELKQEMRVELDKDLKGVPYMFISSVAQQGITELKDRLWTMLNNSSK